uniref:MSP domain-containing protein n=1 Tax=Heterorhabditis bacteriophora TaxID=37862 RepID=A0A1I7WHU6_HETBA
MESAIRIKMFDKTVTEPKIVYSLNPNDSQVI